MFRRRRVIGLFLVFLLLAMQAFWLVHRCGHELGTNGNGEAACEFCLSMHGMGAALPGAARAVAVIPATVSLPPDVSVARSDADPVQPRQQGPPRLS
ncbi:MAG: hypothetical protein LBT71_11760 [Azoarcus sp.]|jgi:hypothetical protein|nr:hypothetical protein [Azoarcus sp.]